MGKFNLWVAAIALIMSASLHAESIIDRQKINDFCSAATAEVKGRYYYAAIGLTYLNQLYQRDIYLFPTVSTSDMLSVSLKGKDYKALFKYKGNKKQSELIEVPVILYNGKDRFGKLAKISFGTYDHLVDGKITDITFHITGKDLSPLFTGRFLKFSIDDSSEEFVLFDNLSGFPGFVKIASLKLDDENSLKDGVSYCMSSTASIN